MRGRGSSAFRHANSSGLCRYVRRSCIRRVRQKRRVVSRPRGSRERSKEGGTNGRQGKRVRREEARARFVRSEGEKKGEKERKARSNKIRASLAAYKARSLCSKRGVRASYRAHGQRGNSERAEGESGVAVWGETRAGMPSVHCLLFTGGEHCITGNIMIYGTWSNLRRGREGREEGRKGGGFIEKPL